MKHATNCPGCGKLTDRGLGLCAHCFNVAYAADRKAADRGEIRADMTASGIPLKPYGDSESL